MNNRFVRKRIGQDNSDASREESEFNVTLELNDERENHDEDPDTNTIRTNWSLLGIAGCINRFFSQGLSAIKSIIFHNEDDMNFRLRDGKHYVSPDICRKELWVQRDNTNNCSSEELLSVSNIEHMQRKNDEDAGSSTNYTKINNRYFEISDELINKDTIEELQVNDLNLQIENDKIVDDGDVDSIVLTYIRNRNSNMPEVDSTLLSAKKKSSILNNIPKMETIPEGAQFLAFPIKSSKSWSHEKVERSEISNDDQTDNEFKSKRRGSSEIVLEEGSRISFLKFLNSTWELPTALIEVDEFYEGCMKMHEPSPVLWMATIGDSEGLEYALCNGGSVNDLDHFGRTALHLAAESGSARAVQILLQAGLDPNAEDGLTKSPLSYALIRRPSLAIAKLLFEYGAVIPKRKSPIDVGLFLEFVIMCTPTPEEQSLMALLIENGARLEDPEAPGGRQALHYAAMSNNLELINLLANLGADLNSTNHRYMTPMEVAIFYSCKHAEFRLEDIGISNILASSSANIRQSQQSFLQLRKTSLRPSFTDS